MGIAHSAPAMKTDGPSEAEAEARPVFAIPFAERIGRTALVVGTFDTKGAELLFIRDRLRALGIPVRTVDLSTSGKISRADVTPMQVAAMHPRGSSAVFSGDRGESVAAMADAFGRWIERERGIGGVISAGGSGGTSLATAGMRRLPLGIPKIMVSTVASGEVGRYVGSADIMMLHSVADVQGLNPITEQMLGNAAHALGRNDSRNAHGRGAGSAAASRAPRRRHHHVRGDDAGRASAFPSASKAISTAWCSMRPASAGDRWRASAIPGCWRGSSI